MRERASISVFFKLFLVVLITGIILNFLAATAFVLGGRPSPGEKIPQNIQRYSYYLAQEFAIPEQREKAKELVQSLGLSVKVEGKHWSWNSDPTIPDLSTLPPTRFDMRPPFPGQSKSVGVHNILEVSAPDGPLRVYVGGLPVPGLHPNFFILFCVLALVSLVLVTSFLAIRRILAPLRALSQGVEALSQGDFIHRVPVESNDEFAALAGTFNQMIVRVREMISAKEQLLLDVSHELRSPLGRAQIALELVKDDKATARVTRELEEMETMIHTLLESARYDNVGASLDKSEHDLISIVRDIAQLHDSADRRILVESILRELCLPIDAEKIGTVVRNLLENALKYSEPSAPIVIEVRKDARFAWVSVRDSGQGIPAEEVQRIFEPFYRVDRSRTRKTGGYGLGLSLCKRIVEAHGGTISASSRLNEGTTFTFSILLAD